MLRKDLAGAARASPAMFPDLVEPATAGFGPYRDGRLDVAVANFVSDDVSVLIGDGNGGFPPEQRAAAGNAPNHMLTDDLDRDGDADLVTVNQASDDVSVLLGDGAGGFAPQVKYPTYFNAGHQPYEAAAGDFNNDGKEMSYCDPSWISDYDYTAIRNHIQQNFSAVDSEGDFLSVYGTIDPGAKKASALPTFR